MPSSRAFVFTLNNWTEDQKEWLLETLEVEYIMLAQEVGEQLTPHLQGYLRFNSSKTISAAQKAIQKNGGPRMALFIANGSFADNLSYIQGPYDKNGKVKPVNPTFEERGTRPSQGKRTDIHEAVEFLRAGGTIADMIRDDIHVEQVVKYTRGLQVVATLCMRPRNFKTEVFWIHGPTGTGKSRWVWEQVGETGYSKPGGSKWWCGYHGQEDVILDDFRPSKEIAFEYLLNLLDRYPMQVETKGGMVQMIAKRIYITTPLGPLETFKHWEWLGQECLNQLMRRIDHIIQFPQLAATMKWTKEDAPTVDAQNVAC